MQDPKMRKQRMIVIVTVVVFLVAMAAYHLHSK